MTVAPHTSLRRAALLEQLIVALTSAAADSLPIRTRAPDDPTIALLDAWATTGDVLGFYLDRIAAEGYLPSATDAGSILALAGAVGYRPLPGLAAQTYLAYAMAPDPTDTAVRFDQGLLFQSVPGAGQQPQTFESAAPLVAKPSWNLLAPKAGTSPAADATSLVVASTTTNLAPNDMILMQLAPTSADASVAQATAVVAAVNVDYTNGVTDVRLQAPAQVSGGATGAAGAAGSPAVAEPAASGGSGESPAAPTDAGGAIDGLLRSGLAKAAVTLPDSANDLSRSPRTAFAGDSDTVPRLLSALQPAVAGSLYAALDSTVIGAPAVTGAARLQVNAAPFGANAPPQTVFDASGRPAGTRPWPIGDAFTLALTITRADLNALLVHVLDAARGAETGIAVTETPRIPRIDIRCATAQAAGNATIALTSGESRWSARPPGFGEVTLTRNGTTLEFASSASGEAPAVTLSLAWNETTSAFDIRLVDPAPPPDDTAQSWDPRATTAFSAAIGDVQLAIGWTPPATADSTVTISLLVPLPLSDRTTLLLDAVHAGIVSGTTIVVTGADPATTVVSSVTSVSTVAAAAYGTTGSVTRLTLADPWIGSDAVLQSDLSAVTVHAQPAALPLNPTPITTPIGGSAIELSTTVAGIEPGRLIVLAGTRADLPSGASAPAAEVAMVQAVSDGAVPGDTVHSTLQLTSALAYSYERDTVSIYGNVAPAHQGATITQVLGSGQPAATPQTFTLNAGPVLADPAASASGFQSTLTVTVDGIGYAPVDRFDASTPSRSYLESTDAAGNTTISFPGPLPAGNGNVIATCRTGDGTQGNVAAGQISQLLTRPAGLSSVTNPMATAGGSGGDDQDAVRTSLPLGLGALGRIVTVADYAALAGSFAGIGKAAAAWDPQDGVTVTIAATAAEPLDPGGSLCVGVAGAIGAVADPSIAFAVVPAALLVIALTADVVNDPLVSWDETATGVEVALQGAFAYPQRSLGENVAVSDLVAAAHTVPSVLSFTVTGLALLPVGVDATALSNRLPRLLAGSVAPVATLHGALREWRLTSTRGATQAAAVAYLSPAARDIVILNQQSA